jgi:nucleotide-binding universal stress UspA family protein
MLSPLKPMNTNDHQSFALDTSPIRRLRRIIVGHDFDAGGELALEAAFTLVGRSRATIRLVHVVEPIGRFHRWRSAKSVRPPMAVAAARAGARLDQIVASRSFNHRALQGEIRVGDPASELNFASWAWRADLMIIGRTAREPRPFGSTTAERLVRKAEVPVLVACAPLSSAMERVLVPTNFSLASRIAAEQGLALAQSVGGRAFFFHALDSTPWYTYPWGDEMLGWVMIPELTPADVEKDWTEFLDSLPIGAVRWETCTEPGRAVALITRYAETIRADAVVVGTEGRTGLGRLLFSSVAEAVVRSASLPVLTLSPQASQFRLPSNSSLHRKRRAYG